MPEPRPGESLLHSCPPFRKVSGPERLRERSRTRILAPVANRRFATFAKSVRTLRRNWQIGRLDRIFPAVPGSDQARRAIANFATPGDPMTEQAKQAAAELAAQWASDPRWAGVQRS